MANLLVNHIFKEQITEFYFNTKVRLYFATLKFIKFLFKSCIFFFNLLKEKKIFNKSIYIVNNLYVWSIVFVFVLLFFLMKWLIKKEHMFVGLLFLHTKSSNDVRHRATFPNSHRVFHSLRAKRCSIHCGTTSSYHLSMDTPFWLKI